MKKRGRRVKTESEDKKKQNGQLDMFVVTLGLDNSEDRRERKEREGQRRVQSTEKEGKEKTEESKRNERKGSPVYRQYWLGEREVSLRNPRNTTQRKS